MIEPLYFGKKSKILFGVYYPPQSDGNIDTAVVLCYPMGQEYIRSHKTFVHLARKLSHGGYHVLKFDYYGCGDSAGLCEEADIDQWILDVQAAIKELKEGSGARRIFLIGLRLGATLALLANNKNYIIDGIVLWDPIVNGIKYLDELRDVHRRWFWGSFCKNKRYDNANSKEILGHPLTNKLTDQLEAIDLVKNKYILPEDILLIESFKNKDIANLREYMIMQNANLEYVNIPGSQVWIKGEDESKSIVPPKIIQYIWEWFNSRSRA